MEFVQPDYAGFGVRAGAAVIDFLVTIPLVLLVQFTLLEDLFPIIPFFVSTVLLFYKPFMEYRFGATLGKMAVGIKVVGLHYQPISFGRAFLRLSPWWPIKIGTIIINAYYALGISMPMLTVSFSWYQLFQVIGFIAIITSCLTVLANPKDQSLHDLFAKTYCVYKN